MSQAGEGLLRSPETVCVTGAAGFIASWLVKGLLLKGYVVRGTARNPGDPKNRHLRSLEGAKERLTLHQADLLDCGSLRDAFMGCSGVFHVASPVTNNPDLVRDAVEGTRNVIRCAADVGVRRVVFTSSIGAVHMNPNRSPDAVIDESVWSDPDYCRNTKNWYCYAKMAAEIAGMEEARDRGVQLLVVVPPVTIGPMLQRTLSTSVYHLVKYLTGGKKAYPNAVQGYVDVRDVARAHILVYESPAASGRYLCLNVVMHRAQLVHMLKDMFPMYPVTTRCEDEHNPEVKPYKFSNKRLKDLGLEFTPIRQSISDTFSSLRSHGYLLDDTAVGRPIRVGYSAL